jgi:hypothetical protein
MRDDLLHATASVDWAEAQFSSFQQRLNEWLEANVHARVKELPPDVPNNLIVVAQKEALPLSLNVEAGAYLNAIRSSLDILASTLATRHCPELVAVACFPVASGPDAFAKGKYTGKKFIEKLPCKERQIIEDLKPYEGGHEYIYALHSLDIVRKHRRLLSVSVSPNQLGIAREAARYFEPYSVGIRGVSDEETALGSLRKGAPDPKIKFSAQVCIVETEYMRATAVIPALQQFAITARSIIGLFE